MFESEGKQPRVLSENSVEVGEDDKVYGFAVAGNRFVLRVGRELIAIGR